MAELQKMFKTKPGCFGKYNKSWTLCTQQCNFRLECMKQQIRLEGKESRKKYGRSVSEAMGDGGWDANAADKHFAKTWNIQPTPQRRPSQKPKPKVRVFHMPPPPVTRLMFGSVTDVNMAIMFGLYKYGDGLSHALPSEIAEEYDRLMAVPDDTFQEERLGKLKQAASRHWKSWEEFIKFMET